MSTVNNISSYLNNYNLYSQLKQQKSSSSTGKSSDGDSYVSTVADNSAATFSDTYNDLISQIQSSSTSTDSGSSNSGSSDSSQNSSTSGSGSTSSTSASDSTSSASSASGSGSASGSSSSSDGTTTEIVTINGVTYLEITTTENGTQSVKRTPIGNATDSDNTQKTDQSANAAANKATTGTDSDDDTTKADTSSLAASLFSGDLV